MISSHPTSSTTCNEGCLSTIFAKVSWLIFGGKESQVKEDMLLITDISDVISQPAKFKLLSRENFLPG